MSLVHPLGGTQKCPFSFRYFDFFSRCRGRKTCDERSVGHRPLSICEACLGSAPPVLCDLSFLSCCFIYQLVLPDRFPSSQPLEELVASYVCVHLPLSLSSPGRDGMPLPPPPSLPVVFSFFGFVSRTHDTVLFISFFPGVSGQKSIPEASGSASPRKKFARPPSLLASAARPLLAPFSLRKAGTGPIGRGRVLVNLFVVKRIVQYFFP